MSKDEVVTGDFRLISLFIHMKQTERTSYISVSQKLSMSSERGVNVKLNEITMASEYKKLLIQSTFTERPKNKRS